MLTARAAPVLPRVVGRGTSLTFDAAIDLPAGAVSVRSARRFVDHVLHDAGLEALSDAATLVTSELVTNAVLHARSALTVRLVREDAYLRLEVRDDSHAPLVRRHHSPDAGTGRGLTLVDALAHSWGWTQDDHGKVVWAQLPLDVDAAQEQP